MLTTESGPVDRRHQQTRRTVNRGLQAGHTPVSVGVLGGRTGRCEVAKRQRHSAAMHGGRWLHPTDTLRYIMPRRSLARLVVMAPPSSCSSSNSSPSTHPARRVSSWSQFLSLSICLSVCLFASVARCCSFSFLRKLSRVINFFLPESDKTDKDR